MPDGKREEERDIKKKNRERERKRERRARPLSSEVSREVVFRHIFFLNLVLSLHNVCQKKL